MNQRQMAVLALAALAMLSLSLAAATFGSSLGGPTQSVSSGVFNDQNVTLKDPPQPSSVNLSESRWLQVYYKYFESDNETKNRTNASGTQEGRTDILPVLLTAIAILAMGILGGVIWFRWLRPLDDTSFEEWGAADTTTEPNAEHHTDNLQTVFDPENDVQRAWYALAHHLDIPNTDSYTPRELAVTAVDRGLDREAVSDLTVLFERIRYGQARPTAEREQRARHALERLGIELGDEL